MMSKRVSFVFAVFISIILAISLCSAITGKIGNARAVLYPEVGFFGTTIDRTITVINDNLVPVNVRLEAGENSTLIEIVDKEITLQPGESQEARFKINVKKPGDYTEKVNVFFEPFNGNGAGVALSSTIIVHAKAKGEVDSGDETDGGDGSDNIDSNSTGTNNPINLGNIIGDNKAILIATSSTIVLAILLVVLYLLSRKKKTKKRSDRSS